MASTFTPISNPDTALTPFRLAPTLVVDLDNTLVRTDTLHESVIRLVRHHPAKIVSMPFWLLGGRATFKARVAALTSLSAPLLPYHTELVAYLEAQRSDGRVLVLATAAHRSIAQGVADHLGLFSQVLSTDSEVNLKGQGKLAAIRQHVGSDFAYAGDCSADIPIWQAARAAILVNTRPGLTHTMRETVVIEKEFPRQNASAATWLRGLRVHQWLKNLLLFVPMLTAFSFTDPDAMLAMLLAFFAFSLAASGTYVFNDIWDLESDRAHARKRHRPFASGAIPIAHGLAMAGTLLLVAFGLASQASPAFCATLALYIVVTSAYSWYWKQYVLIDVVTLSLLYTLRIVAGAMALGVQPSSWLLVFSIFIFFSLALVKRCSELQALEDAGRLAARGRDYRVSDLKVLWPLGTAASMAAVVVFGLFISAPETQARYASPALLWLISVGLIYWTARLWVKTSRGEMHDDPVVFAMKDRASRLILLGLASVAILARTLHFPELGA